MERYWSLSYAKKVYKRKSITPLAFLADHKGTFDVCVAKECEAIWDLAYLLCDEDMNVCETYTANGMNTNAPVYHELCPVVINVFT